MQEIRAFMFAYCLLNFEKIRFQHVSGEAGDVYKVNFKCALKSTSDFLRGNVRQRGTPGFRRHIRKSFLSKRMTLGCRC